jgi:hypothetical protein
LILIFSVNTNRESVAYRSFSPSKFEARGARKVTTGIKLWCTEKNRHTCAAENTNQIPAMSSDFEFDDDSLFDDVYVEKVNGEVCLFVPIRDANLPSSSAGSTFVPSSSSPEPPSDDLASLVLGSPVDPKGKKKAMDEVTTYEDRFRPKIEEMRARCQSVRGDASKGARSQAHEDGKTLARGILARLDTEPQGWCRLAKLRPTKTGGYAQVSAEGANKFATLQEVVLWAKGGVKPPPVFVDDGNGNVKEDHNKSMEVSHLCDQPQCIVMDHICVEARKINLERKDCKRPWSRHPDSCSRCHGKKVDRICSHDPPCVDYLAGFASQEDLLARGVCGDSREFYRNHDEAKRRAKFGLGLEASSRKKLRKADDDDAES